MPKANLFLTPHKGPHLSTPSTVVISDFFHLRIYSLKVFIVFVVLGLPFPQVHLSVGGGGGGGGQQASSLRSKHKLWISTGTR